MFVLNYLTVLVFTKTIIHLSVGGYMSHYIMLSKHGNRTRLLKIKNKLKIGYFYK